MNSKKKNEVNVLKLNLTRKTEVSIMKYFLKTSIPRILQEKKLQK